MDGITDLLLVAAPFYHIQGEEGRVYMYRVNKQVRDPRLHKVAEAVAAQPGAEVTEAGGALALPGTGGR